MKKLMSDMSATEFCDYQHALGLTGEQLAAKLHRAQGTVSQYRSGERAIPADVHARMAELIQARMEQLKLHNLNIKADHDRIVGACIVYHNTNEKQPRAPTFYNRVGNKTERERELRQVLGPYRLTQHRLSILTRAVAGLTRKLKALSAAHPESKPITLALTDAKALAEQIQGLDKVTPPFTLAPTYAEWRVISAALRDDGTAESYAFYQHWRRHKGAGWPVYRKTV